MSDATNARAGERPDPAEAPGAADGAAHPGPERPRRSFHVLLGTILLPGCAVPIVWAFALFWMRRAADPESRRWARRILGLAIVDTIVPLVLGALLFAPVGLPATVDARAVGSRVAVRDPVMIGVVPDDSQAGPGTRVESVVAGGPADRAGVREGDIIVRLGDRDIEGADSLRSLVREQEAGVPVALEWRRDGVLHRAEAVPDLASRMPPAGRGDPAPTPRWKACFTVPSVAPLVPVAAVLVVLCLLAVLAARRGSGAGIWWTALSLVGGLGGGVLAAAGTCASRGGPGGGEPLLVLWGSSLGIAGVALVGLKRAGCSDAPAVPTMRWTRALALACWYAVTGGLRLAVLIAGFARLASDGETPAVKLASMIQDAPPLALLAIPVVLLGPVGEEVAFRGLLQTTLARRWGPRVAIAITSILFAALHWQYGIRLPLIVFLGVVLGWARIASGGLRAPILLHMLVNAVALLSLWRTYG